MVWAMNTGHEGSLTTCHANSAVDALRRLELMLLGAGLDLPLAAVQDQLAAALDLVVHVARLADGSRGVVGVAEVLDPPRPDARVRPLADQRGLHALPDRPARRADGPCPDPAWCR
jgi:Flp pilus assembly CpaF family ATPase